MRNTLREYLQSEGYGGPLQRACDVTLFEGRKDAAVLFDADYFESTMVILEASDSVL